MSSASYGQRKPILDSAAKQRQQEARHDRSVDEWIARELAGRGKKFRKRWRRAHRS